MTKRIEYIDALRGFTMLLVVFKHVPEYAGMVSKDGFSIYTIPGSFHLALFFFLSGWFVKYCYKDSIGGLIKKKFLRLIIPTTCVYILYCYCFDINIIDSLWYSKYKDGYWFCIVLFCFFLIYYIAEKVLQTINMQQCWKTLFHLFLSFLFLFFTSNAFTKILLDYNIPNNLCLQQWKFYIFFWLGSIGSFYKDKFLHSLQDGKFIGLTVFCYILLLIIPNKTTILVDFWSYMFYFIIIGILGIIISFAFFIKYDSTIQQNILGRSLILIGSRTLDIYLLHYFFMPRDLSALRVFLGDSNPTLELFSSLTITVMVVILCLLVSNIIRLSPVPSRLMLGTK